MPAIQQLMGRTKNIRRWRWLLRALMFLLAAIGILMAVRRTLMMAGILPSFNPNGAVPFDTGFGKHPFITFMHILPGTLFMLLGPLQFMPGIRHRYLQFHRISGRVFIVAAYIVGISALCMPFIMLPIGGVNEAAASIFYATWFLVALSRAWWHILKKNAVLHREWMIRAFAIGLAVATVRPIIGLFFGFSGLPPQVFFGTAFWIGFTLHLVLAEVWINYSREGTLTSIR